VNTQREVINASLAATREGRLQRTPRHTRPDVVPRADGDAALAAVSAEIRGALDVARRGSYGRASTSPGPRTGQRCRRRGRNRNGEVFTIASVIVRNGKIAEVDFLADPERLARLDLTILDDRCT
jgi:hypothetical protein